mgnify:CR=1 FL=1
MITVTPDKMTVTMTVPFPPKEIGAYSVSELKKMLTDAGIIYGISLDRLKKIVDESLYTKEVEVAYGRPPKDGADAYYKYYFDVNKKMNTPRILEDGRVDYTNKIETVKKDAILVEYVEPEDGEAGKNVYGEEVPAKRGKKLSMLRGKGFYREDNFYKASFDGKIDVNYDVINVSQVMDINGDVNTLTGDIDFTGDILIKGDVCSGMRVKSGGTITVNGYVEAATLEADGDIIVNAGINGAGVALLIAKGDIKGNFFEGVTLRAKGDVTTNSLLNTKVEVEGSVYVEGKKGIILGGMVNAVSGITAKNIGNSFQVNTTVCIGVYKETLEEYRQYKKMLADTKKILDSYNEFMEKVEDVPEDKRTPAMNKRHTEVLRSRITIKAQQKGIEKKIDDIETIIANGSKASVRVSNLLHPGVKLIVGSNVKMVEQVYKEVEVKVRGDDIVIESL